MSADSRVSLGDLATAARFLGRLPALLRRPLDLAGARALVQRRLARRADEFVTMLRDTIFSRPESPYAELLRAARCEPGDVEALARREGVEGALHALYRAGVYLTIDEFKGRRPAVRGAATIDTSPHRLRNPRSRLHVQARSSGSRGSGTPVVFDLDFIRGSAADTAMFLDARGGATWQHADWEIPGGGSLFRLLKFASIGAGPARWFSQLDAAAAGIHPRYRWSARLIRLTGAACGAPLPRPVHAPIDDPLPVARWMRETRARGQTPHLYAFVSSAVRLCQAAAAASIDIAGARFTLLGEPTTDARLAEIRRVGADGLPRYGAIECGPIGYGCLRPRAADDVHILRDLQAVVQPGLDAARPEVPARALLLTSLHPAAPFVLLNVAMGDAGTMSGHACGCPLAAAWPQHLDTIRSYEKLTAGGMAFLDTDVVRVLEQTLPAAFGGAPTDYQLVEREEADGRPRLALLVDPRVGALDADAVARAFLDAVGAGTGAEHLMGRVWREAGVLTVERQAPLTARSGKILHLHSARPNPPAPKPRT
jgi:hypothetical protein